MAAARQPAGLCAVVGLELAELEAILARENDAEAVAPPGAGAPVPPVLRVNSNNDSCHIFCGPPAGIAGLEAAALAAGALNVVVLPLAMPWHHPGFHGGGLAGFRGLVAAQDWCEPRFPLVSTLDCRPLETPVELIDFVSRQAFEPIDWAALVRHLYGLGVSELYECGPGVSLTQNARFLPGEARWQNCRTLSKRLVAHG
jgi:[acyl-carrier-protein] S-malonyltransferase